VKGRRLVLSEGTPPHDQTVTNSSQAGCNWLSMPGMLTT
jgi:hypothetical protein